MIYSYLLLLLAILLTGTSQVLMKIGSVKYGKGKFPVLRTYLNIPTLIAYSLFLVITVLSVIVLRDIPLKVFYAISSLNFLVVTAFSFWLLHEKIDRNMILALALIVLGVLVFNYSL